MASTVRAVIGLVVGSLIFVFPATATDNPEEGAP
jgi:hypothetical protein